MRQQYFGSECAVLAVTAYVSVKPLDNTVYTNKTKPVTVAFGGFEFAVDFIHFLACCEVGKGNIQLCPFDVHIHADEPPLFGQVKRCFDGVVEQIADDTAKVQLRKMQKCRDLRIRFHGDLLCLR